MITLEQLRNIDADSLLYERSLINMLHAIETKIIDAYANGDPGVTLNLRTNRDVIIDILTDCGYRVLDEDGSTSICILFE